MICTKCGARMMDTDRFCPKCGAKAIKEKRCPECGTLLREGTKFCHKCGNPVENTESTGKASQETLDIPIDAIEQNILSETAAEIRADRRTESTPRRTTSTEEASGRNASHKSTSSRSSSEKSASPKSEASHSSSGKSTSSKSTTHSASERNAPSKKKSSVPAPPPKKRAGYREEEDWDDDDWDDEDDDEGIDAITVMTAIVGCVLLVVVAVLGYQLYRQYVPKNYGQAAEENRELQDEETGIHGQEMEELLERGDNEEDTFTLTVIQNVNVRDNPSTSGTNVLKVAKEGETYTSTGSVGDGQWYAILLDDGSTGYVFHEYVTVE